MPRRKPSPDCLPWSDEQAARGRRLATDLDAARFGLGDLAIEIAGPSRGRGERDGSYAVLARFAETIGLSGEDLVRFRSVASAWPGIERIEAASWTLHRTLRNQPDRHAVLADFIARAHREGFNPTRTRLVAELRDRQRPPAVENDDELYWTDQIGRGTARWVSRLTGEPLPWTLQRRRAVALVMVAEAVTLSGEKPRTAEALEGGEVLMGDLLAVADVLRRCGRRSAPTWPTPKASKSPTPWSIPASSPTSRRSRSCGGRCSPGRSPPTGEPDGSRWRTR